MPEEKEKKTGYKLEELERIQVPGFVSVYANNTNASAGFYDLRLIFGEISGKPGQEKPIIEDRVSVTLAWEHVGPLRDLLDRLLAEYERKYGPPRVQKKETDENQQEQKSG